MIRKSIVSVIIVLLVDVVSQASSQNIRNYGQCITPNGEQAFCVELKECNFLFEMLLKPSLTEREKQFLSRSQCGQDQSVLICCPSRYFSIQPAASNANSPTRVSASEPVSAPANAPASISSRAPPTPAARLQARGNVLPEPGECGITYINRIFGGNATSIDEYPWMALIEYARDGASVGHRCAGSLINNQYILTSAHCVASIPANWTPIQVRLGEWDTTTNPDCVRDVSGSDCNEPHVEVSIEKVIVHPQYSTNSRDRFHDIALLRLSRSVTYTDFIKPICLPTNGSLRQINLDGIVMDIAGWGRTERGSSSNIKLKAAVSGIPLSDCQQVYMKRNIMLNSSQICAGGVKGTDTCNGDSGGPLIAQDPTNKKLIYYFIAGVVSYGPSPCGLEGWPGVYTRVGDYVDWIQGSIEP